MSKLVIVMTSFLLYNNDLQCASSKDGENVFLFGWSCLKDFF